MVHHSACALLLLLTCLADFSASETEQGGTMEDISYGPSSVEIRGVSVVTVGIPYGFECTAYCYPGCQYTWTRGNLTSQGPELTLQLLHRVPTQTLTCTVVNPTTGISATVHKTLQVTAGPSNILISGPPMLTYGTESVFTCSADCYPSCSYSWTVILEEQKYSTAQGSTISVTPPASTVFSETLICEAEDTVSHLYISTTLKLWVASSSDIQIAGESTVTMGKQYTFTCTAACIPSCEFTWKYMGKTFEGGEVEIPILHQGEKPKFKSQLEITVSDYWKVEPLTCEATNTISHATITATMNLTVIDPISVRPISQAQPVAGKPFSLQCVGSQNPTSITWLKNKHPIPASERVHFSPDNTEMSFSPLLQTDDGLYQCVVAEGGTPIQSVGYKMQVNYGPSSVVINGVDIVTLGKQHVFQCSASCYPTCQFTWTCGKMTSQGPGLSLQVGELHPTENLTCTAVNPATGMSATAQKTLQVTAGPSNMQISGPAFLTAGVASNFTCSADCYPSCSYTWTVLVEEQTFRTAQGSTISVTPVSDVASETLTCKAQDTVSHLYISTVRRLWVANPFSVRPTSQALPAAVGPKKVTISGPDSLEIGVTASFTCSAECSPSCIFTWTLYGKNVTGNVIDISVNHHVSKESISCWAENTFTGKTVTVSETLSVSDPHWCGC
ncbi:hemicentin-2-like protein [Lates japonicus]|uniref:Hemicentin-2-like protein n=1 Tax=Lates japonicus TaxID=270547 RepID=A0AAD3M728_LATJO|nr:hemicentin-2-like protein [Lates japonicus]